MEKTSATIQKGMAVEVRNMSGTVLQINKNSALVEAIRSNGSYTNIWVSLSEIVIK